MNKTATAPEVRERLAFCRDLVMTLHAVETRLEAAVEPVGLSLGKFGVLAQLADAGEPLPLGTLAERSACVRSNITQLVDRLEADRLVVRTPDPRDRRSVRAELTAEGRARHAAALRALDQAERTMFAHIDLDRRQELARLLGFLRSGF